MNLIGKYGDLFTEKKCCKNYVAKGGDTCGSMTFNIQMNIELYVLRIFLVFTLA